ncbi:MAG: tRNA (adenosine(37)-N6)-threonylcarbamoyltransferase complex dimerization subunit type 1 TsaB [Christensenellales bacterium]
MIILALDTSGPSAGVAILQEGALRYEATAVNALTHSANLMPLVEEALAHSGLDIRQIDLFGAVVGPGSFTGVRIGVSAVKAMAQALERPCLGINALEALARGLAGSGRTVCPIRDARVRQVYGAAFRDGRRLMPDAVMKLEEYLDAVRGFGGELCFVGDAVSPLGSAISAALGARACFAPPHLNLLKAGAAALIALENKEMAGSPDDLLPLYLRAPQAERERQARHG